MRRIGIFGGSFNPPHLGHLLAAHEMQKILNLDKVILIPAGIPPHKQLAEDSPNNEMRLALTKTIIENEPGLEVSDIELIRDGASYTADTLLELHKIYPDDELYLLMGTDMFLSFHTWSRPELISSLAYICLALRETPTKKVLAEIEKQANYIRENYNSRVIRIFNDYLEMSSTLIRRMISFQCAETYLKPKEYDLIIQNQLYSCGINLKNLSFDELCIRSLSLHKENRRPHVIGCSETARALAKLWGADPVLAERAGILHDITKALDKSAHLALCKKYGIQLRPFEVENEKLLHSKSGAAVALNVFGECQEIADAIYWHTTGKANMTLLEKIIYLADYMEPNRNFEGVEVLRKYAWSDIDRAMLLAFEMSVDILESKGKVVDDNSREARDFMRVQLGEDASINGKE